MSKLIKVYVNKSSPGASGAAAQTIGVTLPAAPWDKNEETDSAAKLHQETQPTAERVRRGPKHLGAFAPYKKAK